MIADQYEIQEDTGWAPVMGEARAVKQSYAWRLRLPVCIVLGMAAAVFLVVGLSRQAPGIVSEGDDYDTTAVLSLLELSMAAAVFLVVGLSRQAPGTVSKGDDYDSTAVLSLFSITL